MWKVKKDKVMKIHKNLKIAFNELINIEKIFKGLGESQQTLGIVEPSMRKFLSKSQNVQKEESQKQEPQKQFQNISINEPLKEEEKKPEKVPEIEAPTIPENPPIIRKRVTTLIASDAVIHGIIHAKGDLEVCGTVIGEIICDHTITFRGNLKGTIHAEILIAESGILEGDIFAKQIEMKEEAQLIGRLQIGGE